MSRDGEDVTPSVDRYQPQHVVGRQHAQLIAPSEQTGNGNPTRDDDVIVKIASKVTADVISSAFEAFAAEQSDAGKRRNRKHYPSGGDPKPTVALSDAVQSHSTLKTSLESSELEDERFAAGNESPASNHKPETLSTSGDGPEAEALEDIARLQASGVKFHEILLA